MNALQRDLKQRVCFAVSGDFALRIAQGVELVYTEQDRLCVLRFSAPAMADGRTRRCDGEHNRRRCRSFRSLKSPFQGQLDHPSGGSLCPAARCFPSVKHSLI